jgi:hypothetical protein
VEARRPQAGRLGAGRKYDTELCKAIMSNVRKILSIDVPRGLVIRINACGGQRPLVCVDPHLFQYICASLHVC